MFVFRMVLTINSDCVLNNINRLVFAEETYCVSCEVWTGISRNSDFERLAVLYVYVRAYAHSSHLQYRGSDQ
jgi:hypothetical protein